ncbi:uncharacterized protein CC84DRAFT_1254337 [Paraphaeosphaeria sporulosa]|uniref:Uncharacterized protein n=1 Tax=Paraphaeosphaeria sporulosa TaxID=1460663 RepID=A0A177CYR7_9PLEO|nr:uncharacterized protein CC84DRAFT_1254337 [Paraphaeosphaeria sporulosa]OAG11980.1 hypothetical protein CC84DRAFT_1254337 [Paraphaeosphaeria sporulosa]
MQLPTLTLLTLSTLATLSTSTPVDNGIPISNVLTALGAAKPVTPSTVAKPVTPSAVAKPVTPSAAPKPATLPATTKPSTLPAVGAAGPHISSLDDIALLGATGSVASTPAILTYLRSTTTEVKKHTLNINNTLASYNRLDLNFLTKRASSIIQIRSEVTVICYSLTQLNTASIGRWTDSIGDLASVRAQLLAAVQELVWEIVFTLRGALTIWELLGSQVLVLLVTFGQLFCILNVWIDGFLKLALGLLNAQIGILTSVFAGVLSYVVDVAGGLFTQVTKLLTCLLS